MTVLNGFSNTTPGYDDIIAFHKANMEALIQSNARLASGFQELSRDFLAEVQESLDDSASKTKLALEASSIKDAIELAVDNSITGYQKLAATSAKLTQQSWKVLSDAMAPVAARMTEAADSAPILQKETTQKETTQKEVRATAPKRGVSPKHGASAAA
jgi:phasin family protein